MNLMIFREKDDNNDEDDGYDNDTDTTDSQSDEEIRTMVTITVNLFSSSNNNIQIQPGLKAKLLLTRIYDLNQTINLYSTTQLTLEHIHVTNLRKRLSDFREQ